jgi:hypothetical protein
MNTTDVTSETAGWIRRISLWPLEGRPVDVSLEEIEEVEGFPWFELACDANHAAAAFDVLSAHCPGLTHLMLEDLLTPDDQPTGKSYESGEIRLASSFSVVARRPDEKSERGTPQGVGVLAFQPVELLAGPDWLVTCWHPRRVFQGPKKIKDEPADDAVDLHRAVVGRWEHGQRGNPADLGVSVMHELALTYAPAHRRLYTWLEDWELSLYIKDGLENQDQLPELWGLMAVLRDWLNPLNKPGLRADLGKAWLPATNHEAVIQVDDRVDRALAGLSKLSETLRQSFGLLHLEQTEEQRRHSERMQHRIEIAAAVFLVPTLVVGFYGANTWVPGQGKHWGFWVMVGALVILSLVALLAVLHLQDRSRESIRSADSERERIRSDLLRST